MAYTPIGWQTGDTITAEKLNKMDNGWGVENALTVLTEETVTTSVQYGMNIGEFAYSEPIDADVIYVTFNGTRYECPVIDNPSGSKSYGDAGEQGPAFTEFPFAINSSTAPDGSVTFNSLYTETAGTYTVKIEGAEETIETSTTFRKAVNSCVNIPNIPKVLECVEGVTGISEAKNFLNEGGILYFTAPKTATSVGRCLFFINEPSLTCTIFPESTTLHAGFGRDSGLFEIDYI